MGLYKKKYITKKYLIFYGLHDFLIRLLENEFKKIL